MKKFLALILITLIITGCSKSNTEYATDTETEPETEPETIEITDTEDAAKGELINDEPETTTAVSKDYARALENNQFEELDYQTFKDFITITEDRMNAVILITRDDNLMCQRLVPIIGDYLINRNRHNLIREVYYLDVNAAKEEAAYYENNGFEFICDLAPDLLEGKGCPVGEDGKTYLEIPFIIVVKDGVPVAARAGVADGYTDATVDLSWAQYDDIIEYMDSYFEILEND